MDNVMPRQSPKLPTGYQVFERLTDAHIDDLWRMYQGEWWTRDRQLADIHVMLENSDLALALCESDRLVAFARVLTDYVFKAFILDVIVEPSRRGRGLGRALFDSVLNHPSLRKVRHFELYCLPEMMPFYRQWGFTEDLCGLHLMRRADSG